MVVDARQQRFEQQVEDHHAMHQSVHAVREVVRYQQHVEHQRSTRGYADDSYSRTRGRVDPGVKNAGLRDQQHEAVVPACHECRKPVVVLPRGIGRIV